MRFHFVGVYLMGRRGDGDLLFASLLFLQISNRCAHIVDVVGAREANVGWKEGSFLKLWMLKLDCGDQTRSSLEKLMSTRYVCECTHRSLGEVA